MEINIMRESNNRNNIPHTCVERGGGVDVPLFETIKTNAETQPKNELQQ